jgi:transcriptional regulator with XRE-family HTH domain
MYKATPRIVARAFGDVLHGARMRRHLEAATVAARGGIDLDHLNKLEQGRAEPSLSVHIRSAIGLGVSPTWLLEEVLSWLNLNEGACAADDLQSRRALIHAAGSAFTATLYWSSEQDLLFIASTQPVEFLSEGLGERFVHELAKQGLVIISLPRSA